MEKNLNKHKIKHDDTLFLYYHIHVVDLEGDRHTFAVKPDDSVDDLRKMIEDKTGVLAPDQIIIRSDNAAKVSGGTLRSDHGVHHDDTLYLRPLCPSKEALEKCPDFKGKACASKGGSMCTKCDDGCYPGKAPAVCFAKEVYYDHCKAMIIHVVDLDGNKNSYEVTPMDLLSGVKSASAVDAGMPLETIKLKDQAGDAFGDDDDDATLENLKIKNEDTLYMFYHIHVVDYDGKRHTFDVKPNDSVAELKKLVYDVTGIVASDQMLTKEDKSTRVLSDRLYADNGVVHDETLYMQPPCPSVDALNSCPGRSSKSECQMLGVCSWCPAKKKGACFPGLHGAVCAEKDAYYAHCFQVHVVDLENVRRTYVIDISDPLEDLYNKSSVDALMPVDTIYLSYGGKVLSSDERARSFADLSVKNDDEFKMRMKIFVDDFNGGTHEYFVDPSTQIASVRSDASDDSGIPIKHVHLQFNDVDMNIDSTLGENDVKHLDTLKMIFTVNVVDIENFKFQISVKPGSTIDEVKGIIREKTGMRLQDIHIQFNKRDLEDMEKTIDDEGVVHEDTLLLVYVVYVVDSSGKKYEFKIHPTDSIDDLKKMVGDKIGKGVDEIELETWNGYLVNFGTIKSNNVAHEDTLYMGFDCPAQEAFEFCPALSKQKCKLNTKAKKLCTWCDDGCRAGRDARTCVDPYIFKVCTRAPTSSPTSAPTMSPDYCPRGMFLSGSEWACDDKSKRDLGYGPASWTHSQRCRGFDDKK